MPVNCVLVDRGNSDTLYVGSDVGVFRKSAGSTSWVPLRNGMPPAIVTDLVSDNSGKVYAATHGRGVYELTMIDPLSARATPTPPLRLERERWPSKGRARVGR